jgi:uncharacterized Zn-binding protein involved in type VI secretion
MSYLLGVVLFALAILISVSLHEAGHMLTAKAFGMKVTRYFVGFGPTLWSFKRGETEYGIKGIPLGGFCKIVGMTPQDDDVEPGDEKRAMWRYPVWKRTIVMSAGSITHFALALIALWIIAITAGLPNPKFPSTEDGFKAEPAVIALAPCVVVENAARACQADDPASPAEKAQLKDGDRITAVNGRPVSTWGDMLDVVRATPPGAATVTFERDGRPQEARVDLAAVQRPPLDDPKGATSSVSALGVALRPSTPPRVEYGPIAAFGATADRARHAAHPAEGARAVERDHRQRARHGHPDQRGRRHPARRRGRGEQRLAGVLHALRVAELLHRRVQPAAVAPAGRRAHRHRLVRTGALLAVRAHRPPGSRPGRLPQTHAVHVRGDPDRWRVHAADSHRRCHQPHHALLKVSA